MIGEMAPLLFEMQNNKLDITNLTISTMDKNDGVIVQITSSDPDGKRMGELFGKLFSMFPKMLESQGVKVKTVFLDKNGKVK